VEDILSDSGAVNLAGRRTERETAPSAVVLEEHRDEEEDFLGRPRHRTPMAAHAHPPRVVAEDEAVAKTRPLWDSEQPGERAADEEGEFVPAAAPSQPPLSFRQPFGRRSSDRPTERRVGSMDRRHR
jgi:hypothetical protein